MGCGSSSSRYRKTEKRKDFKMMNERTDYFMKILDDLKELKGYIEDLKYFGEEYPDKKAICLRTYTEMTDLFEDSKKKLKVLLTFKQFITDEEDFDTTVDYEQIMPVDLYIFEQGNGDAIKNLRAKLIEMLEETIKTSSYQINVIPCSDLSKVRREIPLLILCVAASRVGSDAEEAIKGVPDLSKTMLLIFHPQSYPMQEVTPSELVLTDKQFRSLGGILDFIYNAEKNVIYSCKTNKSALNSVANFVGKFLTVHF